MRILVLVILGLMLTACEHELETGYRPTKLGVTSEERRAYYAPQFSSAAAEGRAGKEKEAKMRRPAGY